MKIKVGNPISDVPLHFYLEEDDDEGVIQLLVTRGKDTDVVLTLDPNNREIIRGNHLDAFIGLNIKRCFDLTDDGEIKLHTEREENDEN